MEAPKKIYICPSDLAGIDYEEEWLEFPWGDNNIEYTRTDAFIEKAIGWIDYNNRNGGCFFDGWEKDFRKYMKEE